MQELGGTKALTSRISKLLGNATKLFGGLFPPTIPGLLSLTSGGRKNKRIELDDRKLTLRHEKVTEKALLAPLAKILGERDSPSFVITDLRQ